MRISVGLIVLMTLAIGLPSIHSEMSDAEKRALFLRAREDIRPVPQSSATPRPRPTPAQRPTPAATPRKVTPKPQQPTPAPTTTPSPKTKPTPEEAEAPESTPEKVATPEPTPEPPDEDVSTPKPTPTPRPTATPRPTPKSTPTPKPRATPTPRPTPKPKATPTPQRPNAPIVVEKSGKAKDEGFVAPPKKSGGFFGGGPKYRYLTPSVRAAIDNAKVKKGRWKYIIIHNSATRQGNAKAFDSYHRNVRKMQNGLAYHFVIGNGSSSGDGEIEIGNRWVRQINGGHVASDYLNNISIGICFVGDFNRDLPTKAQAAALQELTMYLRQRCGKVQGKLPIVRGHKQINPKPTDCPGDRFPLKWLNSTFKDS